MTDLPDGKTTDLDELLGRVPPGWTRHVVNGRPWGVSRVEHVDGRTTTLTAEQLGGASMFSANIWHTSNGPVLRPCEVPARVVLDFLEELPATPRLSAVATRTDPRS